MSIISTNFAFNLPGCFLAGGAILSRVTKTEINDYDIYPKTNKALVEAAQQLLEDNCFVVNVSDRAITFKSNNVTNDKDERAIIQLMTYDTFESAEKIFEHFDFTVCMGALDFDTKQYHFHSDFFPDIASKTLRFNPKTKYPLNSLLRVTKYFTKGFNLSKPEHIRMILTTIQNGMPTSWEQLESQIGGVYGKNLRLERSDLPFTLENALSVLSEINSFDLLMEESEVVHDKWDDTMMEYLFSDTPTNTMTNMKGEYVVLNDDCSAVVDVIPFKPKHYTEVCNQTRFTGYKVLTPNSGNDTYSPGLYNYGKKTSYKLLEETVEETAPYLFVFPTIDKAKSRSSKSKVIFEVSYSGRDVMEIKNGEILVRCMKLERQIES